MNDIWFLSNPIKELWSIGYLRNVYVNGNEPLFSHKRPGMHCFLLCFLVYRIFFFSKRIIKPSVSFMLEHCIFIHSFLTLFVYKENGWNVLGIPLPFPHMCNSIFYHWPKFWIPSFHFDHTLFSQSMFLFEWK